MKLSLAKQYVTNLYSLYRRYAGLFLIALIPLAGPGVPAAGASLTTLSASLNFQSSAYASLVSTSRPQFQWPTGTHRLNQGYSRWHHGIDIDADTGDPISAAGSGTVIYAGWNRSGYGNFVKIDHGNGYVTCYAHLSKIQVRVGQTVTAGEQIGTAGRTGRATGPHLHFEVRYHDAARNPLAYLP